MTIKELIAKLDECRAALEDDHIPELEAAEEDEETEDKIRDLGDAQSFIENAISYLEDHQ
jgi:hypothetical protein